MMHTLALRAAAVESFALSHGLKRVPGPDPQYEDICWGQAPQHDDLEGLSAVFPSMEIMFDEVCSARCVTDVVDSAI